MISKNGRSPVEPAAIASLNQLSDLIKRESKERISVASWLHRVMEIVKI